MRAKVDDHGIAVPNTVSGYLLLRATKGWNY